MARGKNGIIQAMNNREKSAFTLALAIVGGIAACMRCDASEWVEDSSQFNPHLAAYTVKAYTEGTAPFCQVWCGRVNSIGTCFFVLNCVNVKRRCRNG